MMVVLAEVFSTFGLAISETKTEAMRIAIPRAPATQIAFNAKGNSTAKNSPSPIWEAPSLKAQTCGPMLSGGPVRGG